MRRLLTSLRRFRSDRRGNIAILFGLTIVPIFGMMGVALDYSFANADRTAVQASLDNTALALSKLMPLEDEALHQKAWEIFNANLGKTDLHFTSSDLSINSTANGKLDIRLDSTYTLKMATVLSRFGLASTMPVGAHSQVQWGNTRLRIALVLDNSLSMDQSGKMSALKTATTKLLTQLESIAKDPEDVYISVIPFSRNVNMDPANYDRDEWIDWTAWDADWRESHGDCSISGKNSKSKCEAASEDVGSCSRPRYDNRRDCRNNGGNWSTTKVKGVWTSTTPDHSKWNGCILDRGKASPDPGTNDELDQKIDLPTAGDNNTKWPADTQGNDCTVAIKPLSSDWGSLKTMVSNMVSVGSTNQPIGLVWGWQSLREESGGPMSPIPPEDPEYVYSHTIILMSDGLNTQNRWNGMKMPNNPNVDKRMYSKSGSTIAGTCQNVKKDGVQIFTVQVNTGGDATSTLLQNCASNPSMFYELKTADALVSTFEQIGSALANIHISR